MQILRAGRAPAVKKIAELIVSHIFKPQTAIHRVSLHFSQQTKRGMHDVK
jgi:hypothetical protein